MNTTENNKLIAEFMGFKINTTTSIDVLYNEKTCEVLDLNKLKYHFDWNWLIEVVEKIEKNYIVDICGKAVSIHENNGEMIVDLCGKNYSNKTEAVYNACVKFIKWHNQQNQKLCSQPK